MVATLAALSHTACALERAPQAVQRIDSAGIVIVRYATLPVAARSTIALTSQPRLVIADDALFRVAGAVRLGDGRIVIANGGAQELRFHDAQGRLLHSVGGPGEGPGEFRMLTWLGVLPGDSIIAFDRELRRLQVFDPHGIFVRAAPLTEQAIEGFFPVRPIGAFADGTVVGVTHSIPDGTAQGLQRGTMRIARATTGAAWRSVAEVPGVEQVVATTAESMTLTGYTYGADSHAAAAGDRIVVIDNAHAGFEARDAEGVLRVRVAIDAPRTAVTPQMLDAYVDAILAEWPPGQPERARTEFRRRIVEGPHADFLPLTRAVELDAAARVWLEPFTPPGNGGSRFVVFDSTGAYLGAVDMPAGLERGSNPATAPLLSIGSDHVLGVWRDANGVESVRLYDLRIDLPAPH